MLLHIEETKLEGKAPKLALEWFFSFFKCIRNRLKPSTLVLSDHMLLTDDTIHKAIQLVLNEPKASLKVHNILSTYRCRHMSPVTRWAFPSKAKIWKLGIEVIIQ